MTNKTHSDKLFKKIFSIQEVGVLIPLIILIVIIGFIKPVFFSEANLGAVLRGLAFIGIVAIGETLVILLGDIDISVGSVAGLGAILTCFLATKGGFTSVASLILMILICAGVGVLNGVMIVILKLPAFIATIGTMYVAKGMNYVITRGYPIYPLPDLLKQIGRATVFDFFSIAVIVFLALVIIFEFVLRKTTYGRAIYATGDNIQVAKLAGININLIKISVFAICSTLAGIGGTLATLSLESGISTTGSGWELQAIASAAIGGISMLGGAGSMLGTLLGVIILAVLNNGLVLIGMNSNWQTVSIGLVMVIAVLVDIMRRRKKMKS